ncbi:hypothetical protein IEQ34_012645 [Dendrobium chrysotoxum]|uniref:Uncharacterized protein n=1 Tax=Dendrobium chrysotoxum TaxID=161865 RepID=A0AAV7GMC9_DENCH|nr:hypothetical protein IEQ34_012645 [Dendrobium chrysotoxum]
MKPSRDSMASASSELRRAAKPWGIKENFCITYYKVNYATGPSPVTFKCLINGSRSRDSILAVHPDHSLFAPDLSHIYGLCHSRKTINSPSFLLRGDPSQEEKKIRRREEKPRREQLLLDHRRNSAGTPPELRRNSTEAPPGARGTPELCPTQEQRRNSVRRRNSTRRLSDAGFLSK